MAQPQDWAEEITFLLDSLEGPVRLEVQAFRIICFDDPIDS